MRPKSSARTASSRPVAIIPSTRACRSCVQGGNAIDAGVATVFAASVGRDIAFRVRRRSADDDLRREDARGDRVSGQGPAPRAAVPALFQEQGRVPGNGPLGATIPAMVDAMAIALEAKGTMRLEQVMQPAIELADGFPMYAFLRNFLVSERKATEQYEWSASTLLSDGHVAEVGEMFRQPNLARTMRTIVERREASFAKGARPREGDPRRSRRLLHGRHRAPHRRGGSRRRRRLHLRRPAAYHGADREAGDDEFPWIRRVQGRRMEPGTGAARDVEHPRRRRSEIDGRRLRQLPAHTCTRRSSSHTTIATRISGDPTFTRCRWRAFSPKPYAAARRALIGPTAPPRSPRRRSATRSTRA